MYVCFYRCRFLWINGIKTWLFSLTLLRNGCIVKELGCILNQSLIVWKYKGKNLKYAIYRFKNSMVGNLFPVILEKSFFNEHFKTILPLWAWIRLGLGWYRSGTDRWSESMTQRDCTPLPIFPSFNVSNSRNKTPINVSVDNHARCGFRFPFPRGENDTIL